MGRASVEPKYPKWVSEERENTYGDVVTTARTGKGRAGRGEPLTCSVGYTFTSFLYIRDGRTRIWIGLVYTLQSRTYETYVPGAGQGT